MAVFATMLIRMEPRLLARPATYSTEVWAAFQPGCTRTICVLCHYLSFGRCSLLRLKLCMGLLTQPVDLSDHLGRCSILSRYSLLETHHVRLPRSSEQHSLRLFRLDSCCRSSSSPQSVRQSMPHGTTGVRQSMPHAQSGVRQSMPPPSHLLVL